MIPANGWSAMFVSMVNDTVTLEFDALVCFTEGKDGEVIAIDDTLTNVEECENFVHLIPPGMSHDVAMERYHGIIEATAHRMPKP